MAAPAQDPEGCGILNELFSNGDVQFIPILKRDVANSTPPPSTIETHTVYFVEVLSGTNPCASTVGADTKCYLIRSGVSHDGKLWDWYLMSCPHGPPCLFLQNL